MERTKAAHLVSICIPLMASSVLFPDLGLEATGCLRLWQWGAYIDFCHWNTWTSTLWKPPLITHQMVWHYSRPSCVGHCSQNILRFLVWPIMCLPKSGWQNLVLKFFYCLNNKYLMHVHFNGYQNIIIGYVVGYYRPKSFKKSLRN